MLYMTVQCSINIVHGFQYVDADSYLLAFDIDWY